jgi:hypothetical protein
MKIRTLGAWVCLAIGALGFSGCSSDKNEPGAGPPFEESGDAPDPGPLASCSYKSNAALRCGDPENFDLSTCDRATLASAPSEGVYVLKNRAEARSSPTGGIVFGSAMKLSSDGTRSVIAGGPATVESRQGQTFYLQREWALANGDIALTTYVGCQSSSTQPLTGCYVTCRNGGVRALGTFEAIRATRREGEQEAEGISLVSESFVRLGVPVDIYVTKGHAYVVSVNMHARTGGLTVFDVRDPSKPVLVRTVTLPGNSYWNGVWAKDNALYVASTLGVLIFDISDPFEPVFEKRVPEHPVSVHTVFVEGNRLYAMAPSPHNETLMFDITDPHEPELRTRFVPPGGDTAGYPHDAFAYEGRLYINYWDLGYVIVDARDPDNFQQLGKYQYSNQTSHANAVGTLNGRTIAFEGGENYSAHLRVLDVTEPKNVVKIGEFRLRPQSSIHNMVLVGTRLYIAWYQEGVRVLDVSNPAEPRQIAYFNTFRETDFERGYSFYDGAIGMRVPGDGYVYVVDSSRGLLIFREP